MRIQSLCALSLSAVCVLLSGCGITPSAPSASPAIHATPGVNGRVHGGQQPVTGARIYLYAVATTNGGPSVSLLNAPGFVLSDLAGNFSISNDYTCPVGAYVYLLALGGNPGLVGVNNAAIALGAGLGPCSSLSSGTYLTVNEVTTVAMTQALVNIATSETQVGSASDVSVAFQNIAYLADSTHGLANASSSTLLTPAPALNSLANSIAACVNSTGIGAPCSTLFSAATGTVAATDTFQAALNIAKNPTANVSTIYMLGSPNAVFAPTLSAAPASWSLTATPIGACIIPDGNTYTISTTEGDLQYELRPDVAPLNVANFLAYVNNGSYANSILHRALPGFVLQGGGYKYNSGNQIVAITSLGTVASEFNLSNLRGTLAMALAGAPNTATSQFFFNDANNTSLDTQSGGYTVIAQPVGLQGTSYACGGANSNLATIDYFLTQDTIVNAGSPFDALPVRNYSGGQIMPANLEYVNSITPLTNPLTMPTMPVLTPGPLLTSPGPVSISDSTPGASIYYATYSYVPDPQHAGFYYYVQNAPFALYSGPVTINADNEGIQAYATSPNLPGKSLPNASYYYTTCGPCGTVPLP